MATTGSKTCESLVRRAPSSCRPRHPVSPPRGRGLTLQHGMALSLLPSHLFSATESLSCQAGRGTAEPCGTETRTVRLSSRPRRGSGRVSPSRSVLLSKWDKKGTGCDGDSDERDHNRGRLGGDCAGVVGQRHIHDVDRCDAWCRHMGGDGISRETADAVGSFGRGCPTAKPGRELSVERLGRPWSATERDEVEWWPLCKPAVSCGFEGLAGCLSHGQLGMGERQRRLVPLSVFPGTARFECCVWSSRDRKGFVYFKTEEEWGGGSCPRLHFHPHNAQHLNPAKSLLLTIRIS